ncbi:MAG: LysR family transcriptional regulator [Proteobacteria bacterium]|nr:LysR family transcriptional regulator [Pseudomonadota bacterium]
MEMHQIRYFIAAARTLNFTRAAQDCNVAQPSLTRAIKQLEGELGGDLFWRQRPQAKLTELGQRMLPHFQRCYDSALGVRTIASAVMGREKGTLRLALARSIDPALVVPHLRELSMLFKDLDISLLRGAPADVVAFLKKGEAELALAANLEADWDRLDCWPLFDESYLLGVGAAHPLAGRSTINVGDLRDERLLLRNYCEMTGRFTELMQENGVDVGRHHVVTSERDLIALVEANIGITVMPRSMRVPHALVRARVEGFDLRRTVCLYGVAGRQRSAVATAAMKMLRAANWSRFLD